MLPIALGILAVLVVIVVLIVVKQPSEFRVARSATMLAPPPVVFPFVNDFHRWKEWSPWAKIDPQMKETYGGAPEGEGATYAWLGNKKVGEGRMTILESRPSAVVIIKLEFLKPFKSTNTAEFTFKSEGGGTLVTWTMSGRNNSISKVFCMFMNMDKMIGKDFEKGLAQMKAASEAAAK